MTNKPLTGKVVTGLKNKKKKLKASSDKIKTLLKTNEKRKGKNSTEVKSNITDNDKFIWNEFAC